MFRTIMMIYRLKYRNMNRMLAWIVVKTALTNVVEVFMAQLLFEVIVTFFM